MPDPMTPIERAARALVGARINEPSYDGDWDEHDELLARAVIAAIREPSDPMREPFTETLYWDDLDQDDVWTTMIDALLAEGK